MTKVGTNKKKRLSGVVLIMVVTVMFVLIIMLLATLSIVTTAQNKTYAKFEENQAYYSARSALDLYMGTMVSDEVYYAVDANGTPLDHLTPDGSDYVEKYTQSLAMELDFYRIKAHADTYENYLKMSDEEKETFSTDYWVNPDGVFNDEPLKSDYDDPQEPYIEYEVVFPNIENDRKQGKFADPGTKSTIKVEVLSRTLNGHKDGENSTDDKKSIESSSRSKDKITIKVTSTTTFQGYTGTAIGIYSTVDNPSYFQDAVAAFGTATTTNNTSVIGGISTKNSLTLANDGVLYGGLYSEKDTTIPTNQYTFVDSGDAIYVNALSRSNGSAFYPFGYKYVEDLSGGNNYKDIPIVFIDTYDSTMDTFDQFLLDQSFEIGYYTDTSKVSEKMVAVVNGDMICSGTAQLKINGDLIVLGDLDLGEFSMDVTGSVIVTGDFRISGINNYSNGSVGDRIYIGGNFDTSSVKQAGREKNTAFETKVMGTAASERVYSVWDNDSGSWITKYDALEGGEYTLDSEIDGMGGIDGAINPDNCYMNGKRITGMRLIRGVGGTISYIASRVIPTDTTNYSRYYHQEAGREGDIITAREWAGTPNEKDRKNGNFTEIDFSDYSGATPIGNNDTISVTNSGAGATKLLLTGTYNNSTITITGNGTANIYVDNNAGFMNGFELIVGSETGSPKVNIFLASGFDKTIPMLKIWNYDLKYKFENNKELKFGSGDELVKSPTVKIYMDPGTKLSTQNPSIIAGYIYGPDATVNISDKGLKSNGDIWYNGNQCIRSGSNIASRYTPCVIGSIVCYDFNAVNDCLFCYVPDAEDKEPGLPQLEWKPEQYRAS
ncbi:MAG: hypothetical protein ACI4JK_14160 [Oscillospiraceae bacterium]